jgi:beta-N-acetylhexosaminidase
MREIVRKVGQRIMVVFQGHTASPDLRRLVRDYGVGHVILFARNVDTPEQVAELVREVQSIAREARHEDPLLVTVDQEGGKVARLRAHWTEWPPAQALGRTGSEDLARRMGEALAAELSACGIGLDFAPVMDVNTNPSNPIIGALGRSLSDDPDLVGRLGAAMIKGLQDGGVAACAKHFPGHGDTAVDSHLDLPVVDHPRSRLEDVELRPFGKAVEAGVAAVMTVHALVREVDDQWPATLSPRVVRELLRDGLKFRGVVFTDDLDMKAVSARWKPAEFAVAAAKAGCDILSLCADHDAQVEALEALVRAVEVEAITWTELDEAADRIRALKRRFLLPYRDPDPRTARQAAGAGQAWAVAREIAERAAMA